MHRRKFLRTASTAALTTSLSKILRAQDPPPIIRKGGARPTTPHGTAAGDVAHDRAIIWSASDRPAQMLVEWDKTDRFRDPTRVLGPAAIEATDFTGKLDLRNLPPGERIFYRVLFQDLRDLKTWSEPVTGSFITPPRPDGQARDLKIAFTGDVCGQGYGIDLARGGLKMFETMRAAEPDYFIHLGDTIYADNPIQAEQKLDDGTLWKNITSESKAH
ncbi:MAG TPA: PhoD-like phosphatase N-terminal domain-containing protein, partial [Pirellulaceae bacterium]